MLKVSAYRPSEAPRRGRDSGGLARGLTGVSTENSLDVYAAVVLTTCDSAIDGPPFSDAFTGDVWTEGLAQIWVAARAVGDDDTDARAAAVPS